MKLLQTSWTSREEDQLSQSNKLCSPHSQSACLILEQWQDSMSPYQSQTQCTSCPHVLAWTPLPHLSPGEGPAFLSPLPDAQTSAEGQVYNTGQNGNVFIFTGMLDAVADVHQLTIILGHEMAHAVLSHSLIFKRPFSRKLETEANQVGLQLAAKACADVRAGPVFWKQMEIRDQLTGNPTSPEWRSTHPSHKNRVTQLDRLIPQALELSESCSCPDLPATDPWFVFSESIYELLETTKHQGRDGPGGAHKPHSPV